MLLAEELRNIGGKVIYSVQQKMCLGLYTNGALSLLRTLGLTMLPGIIDYLKGHYYYSNVK